MHLTSQKPLHTNTRLVRKPELTLVGAPRDPKTLLKMGPLVKLVAVASIVPLVDSVSHAQLFVLARASDLQVLV